MNTRNKAALLAVVWLMLLVGQITYNFTVHTPNPVCAYVVFLCILGLANNGILADE